MMTIIKTMDVLMLYIILYRLIITRNIHRSIPTRNVSNRNRKTTSHFYNQLYYVLRSIHTFNINHTEKQPTTNESV